MHYQNLVNPTKVPFSKCGSLISLSEHENGSGLFAQLAEYWNFAEKRHPVIPRIAPTDRQYQLTVCPYLIEGTTARGSFRIVFQDATSLLVQIENTDLCFDLMV